MAPPEQTQNEPAVRRRQDEWIEVDATNADASYATDPLVLRPGVDDGQVRLSEKWDHPPKNIRIADLRKALDRVEEMERS